MDTAEEPRRLDTPEAAKLIRRHLKATFPRVKFSVRSDRYAGGSSIDVHWIDGPTEGDVEAITDGFCGGRFEGMSDCPYHADSWYCPEHGARAAVTYGGDAWCTTGPEQSRCCHRAELVHFRSDYVFPHRRISAEFDAQLRQRHARETGGQAEHD